MPKIMLLLFFLTEKPMNAGEIASCMGVSIRQARRMIRTLEDIGCTLERTVSSHYRVLVTDWPESIRKYKFDGK